MGKDINRSTLIKKLEEAIITEDLAMFIGAGISKPAGFFDWKELLKEPAKAIGLDVELEHDLLNVAQYYSNRMGRTEIENMIIESFPNTSVPTRNHELLASLPIHTYWTTNYDNLIEQSLTNANKKYNVKTDDRQLKLNTRNIESVIYKMHGDYQNPSDTVITRDDYEKYGIVKRRLFRGVLEGDLLTKTFLFLGFGFTDPNFNFVLSKMRILLEGDTRSHYCIMKKPLEEEYDNNDEYHYDLIKQKLMIEDLFRSGIKVHLVNQYSEITEILEQLSKSYKRRTIFISGSATDYSPLGKEEAKEFIEELSKNLVEEGFKIVNGYGYGVGTHVINGVANHAYSNINTNIQDFLMLMPFPQESRSKEDLNKIWLKYRKEMINKCGVVLFIYGNKEENGKIVIADGIEDEYEIAKNNEAILFPIKFTGWMAEEISNREKIKDNITYENPSKTSKKIIGMIKEKIEKEKN